ncbi:hypothetical protein BKA56DRAFT_493338 [Ilyonectria sp. MPI-CAGE-AT-0026]|nr:hypothetical protein BKA56DRAFT_493338 [Ilyonectria sp. MPI-CAGE-AT-0026]
MANRLPVVALAALGLLVAISLDSLYGLLYRNGYFHALIRLRNQGPHHLPGSYSPILTRYVGIPPLDKVLTLATVMFANVTDGSRPQLSLYAIQFGGQFLGVLAIIILEALRNGNQRNNYSASVWGCAMQMAAYGFVMPVYCIVHLITSPTSQGISPAVHKAIRVSELATVRALPLALTAGYILPAILMAWPFSTNSLHQWFGGLWQGCPIWTVILQNVITKRIPICRGFQGKGARSSSAIPCSQGDSVSQRQDFSRVYYFAFMACFISHLGPLILIGSCSLYPSAFSPYLRDSWTISSVFVPSPPRPTMPMESMASAMHQLLHYDQYIGSAACLIWSTTLYANASITPMTKKAWATLMFEIVCLCLLAGPIGAVLCLMWNRDDAVLRERRYID